MSVSRKALMLVVALSAALAGSAIAQQDPDLSVLEQQGVTIGQININVEDIFDLTDPGEDKPLYRWANRVHRNTRDQVIEDILLFESGQPLTRQLLEETERLLRERSFASDAEVGASNFDPIMNTADVNVTVRDAWSLEPDLKLSRGGGENEYGIGLQEDNLFGLGKSMTIAYSSDVDRDERFLAYNDDNLFRSRKQLATSYSDLSDGRRFRFAAGRPFYALDTRWAVTSEVLDDERVNYIYNLGEVIDEFRHDRSVISVQGGRSKGLIDGTTRRWLAGLTYEEDEFRPNPSFGAPLLLPDNRRMIYPWAGIQIIGDDFRQVTELNDMGRTEDIALGLDLFARIGVVSPELDSDRRATLIDFSASRGWEPRGPGSLFLFSASATSRYQDGGYQNSIIALNGSFMQRTFGDNLFLASFRTVIANELDAENQILLGGDNDLRGYPLRYQSGERSAILSLEQRFYTDWYPFQLIRVGYAFFLDAGRVWEDDPRNTPHLGTLYDVGVGLRLTSPKSSSRSVVHIDLAFPINAPDDIDDIQIVIEKKASF